MPVLPFLLGLSAKLYGMLWTVVVASKASKTAAIVFPRWFLSLSALDVGCWTHLGTNSATHAAVCFNPKGLVVDELSFEKLADNTAVYAWPTAHIGLFFHLFRLVNLCNDAR